MYLRWTGRGGCWWRGAVCGMRRVLGVCGVLVVVVLDGELGYFV